MMKQSLLVVLLSWLAISASGSTLTRSTYPTAMLRNDYLDNHGLTEFPVSVLTEQQAQSLFYDLANDKKNSFGYVNDGCPERATRMAILAESKGIALGKMWVEGNLQVATNDPRNPIVQWDFHVAPTVYVMKAGKPVLMVLDPSLFDGPTTKSAWQRRMITPSPDPKADYQVRIDRSYFGTRYQFLPAGRQGTLDTWDLSYVNGSVVTRIAGYQKLESPSYHRAGKRGVSRRTLKRSK